MRASLLFLLFCLPACSGSPFSYRSPGPYEGGPLLGKGSYFAEVWFRPAKGAEELRFNAVFARRPGGSIFNAVTSGGKPLLRARDPMKLEAPPELRVAPSELAVTRAQLEEFYRAFRPILLADDVTGSAQPWIKERHPDGRPRLISADAGTSARIDEYDWEGHAFRLELSGSVWTARVALREYDVAR